MPMSSGRAILGVAVVAAFALALWAVTSGPPRSEEAPTRRDAAPPPPLRATPPAELGNPSMVDAESRPPDADPNGLLAAPDLQVIDDDTAHPVAGAFVVWSAPEASLVRAKDVVRTDESGHCALPPRPTGATAIVVRGPGYVGAEVPVGTRLVRLSRAAELRGTVLDDAGRPLGGAVVVATREAIRGCWPLAEAISTRPDDDGNVAISAESGEFVVRGLHAAFQYRVLVRRLGFVQDSSQRGGVLANPSMELVLRMARLTTAHVVAIDRVSGSMVDDADLDVTFVDDSDARPAEMISDLSFYDSETLQLPQRPGAWSIRFARKDGDASETAGTFEIRVSASRSGYVPSQFVATVRFDDNNEVRVPLEPNPKEPPPVPTTFTARTSSGRAFNGSMRMEFRRAQAQTVRVRRLTFVEGRSVRPVALASGTWKVGARGTDHGGQWWRQAVAEQEVAIPESPGSTAVPITVTGGPIRITVRDSSRRSLLGYSLRITGTGGTPPAATDPWDVGDGMTREGGDPAARVVWLPVGRTRLSASHPLFGSAETEVDVVDGETDTLVDLVLHK